MKIFQCFFICAFLSQTLYAQFFTEIARFAGINFSREQLNDSGGGVCLFDYNNDGYEDFFVPGGLGSAALYKNNGNGTFTNVLAEVITLREYYFIDSLITISSIAGDIDNDGDKDLFISTSGLKSQFGVYKKPDILLENLGNGRFANISIVAGINNISNGESVSMGDFNVDGFLDIYVSNHLQDMSFTYDSLGNPSAYVPVCIENLFYINNGNKTFTESAALYGINDAGCGLTGIFTDYDFDNDVDILLANDFGQYNAFPNALFKNNYPAFGFIANSTKTGFDRSMFAMGIAPGDYNEDGHMDYYVTNIGTNSLYRNNGNGTFTDVALSLGVDLTWAIKDSLRKTTWGCNFFDYDNDTYLDLYVNAGYVSAFLPMTIVEDSSVLFRNNGSGTFVNISAESGLASPIAGRGSVVFDFDNDGDLDILSNHNKMQILNKSKIYQNFHLFRNNNINGNNWLKIKLTGTKNNRDAYGSRIVVHAGKRKFIREIDGGSSHASQSSSIAHFGLGKYEIVDSLEVHWLGGGIQSFYNISVNQTLNITEPALLALSPKQKINEILITPRKIRSFNELIININAKIDGKLKVVLESEKGKKLAKSEIVFRKADNEIRFDKLFSNKSFEHKTCLIRFYVDNINILNETIIISD
jgi:hypothetical protein